MSKLTYMLEEAAVSQSNPSPQGQTGGYLARMIQSQHRLIIVCGFPKEYIAWGAASLVKACVVLRSWYSRRCRRAKDRAHS